MNFFKPKLFECMKGYTKNQLISDIVAGIIVAIIALPLSIALAIASGVSPEKGIYTAIIAGFVISALGGSRVNISGPTAAFATIVAGIVAQNGIEGLVIATIMAGIILILMGLLKLGSLIKYIPLTITTGFTSGIAVTIAIGQVKDFLGLTVTSSPIETLEKAKMVVKCISTINLQALLCGGISLLILIIWPKISKRIPGSLVAVLVGIFMVQVFKMNVATIGSSFTLGNSLPKFSLPAVNLNTIGNLLPSAFTIAILAAIESLLSCVVSDAMINDKHDSNTELIAQGMGNICSGLFGGIPATGAIARTAANVNNGGRSPVSGMVHAVFLLLVLVLLMPYAAYIPMPVIAAILFMVAYNMSEWRRFVNILKTAPKSDIIVLILTFVLTVVFDLVVAIEIGMLVSVVLFMKRMADVTSIRKWKTSDDTDERLMDIPLDTTVIEINGPMFFASSGIFTPDLVEDGTKNLILRMRSVSALDVSALSSLKTIYKTCEEKGVRLILSHLNEQPLAVIKKDGFINTLGKENILPNIYEAINSCK